VPFIDVSFDDVLFEDVSFVDMLCVDFDVSLVEVSFVDMTLHHHQEKTKNFSFFKSPPAICHGDDTRKKVYSWVKASSVLLTVFLEIEK
jgi:hypothetical protein